MSKLNVSIAVRAYNQEKEIKKALDSILMQQCNFDIEVVIGVDLSTDDTIKVVQLYIDEAPENIHYVPIFHKQSLGGPANMVSVLKKCSGKYIAWLDGDDYWNDSQKLTKQVNIMEHDSSIGVVYSDDYFESTALEKTVIRNKDTLKGNIFTQMLSGCPITSETALFRTDLLEFVEFDVFLEKRFEIDDYFLWLELTNHTKFHHLKELTSTACLTRQTICDENVPLMSAEYDRLATNIRLFYLEKYPTKTLLSKVNIEDRHYQVFLKAALMCHNKKTAIDNLKKIVNKNNYQQLLFLLFKIPYGFDFYMLYRKLKGKDSKSLYERYFF